VDQGEDDDTGGLESQKAWWVQRTTGPAGTGWCGQGRGRKKRLSNPTTS
jgi:hypothetical protein